MASMQQQQDFDDALHQLVNATRRPVTEAQQTELRSVLTRLLMNSGGRQSSIDNNNDNNINSDWKTVVLALTYKRYHHLAPTAKKQPQTSRGQYPRATYTGNGERLVFYSAFRFLLERLILQEEDSKSSPLMSALQALVRISPLAGGSRDVCQLLHDTVHLLLQHNDQMQAFRTLQKTLKGAANESLSLTVAMGVGELHRAVNNTTTTRSADVILEELLQLAAQTLDEDWDIVNGTKDKNHDDPRQLPSTMHVFVPHHERGRPSKKKQQPEKPAIAERHLVNCVAEVLLFRRTHRAAVHPAFASSYDRLISAAVNNNKEAAKKALTFLQTIIRQWRRELNRSARDQGFMLADQFVHDASILTSRHINAAKAGDLSRLIKLARKDQRLMQLIRLQNAKDPSKVLKFSSVRDLLTTMRSFKEDETDAEVVALKCEIFQARLQATVQYLFARLQRPPGVTPKPVVVASLENQSDLNHVAAVLVAVASSDLELTSPTEALGTTRTTTDAVMSVEGNTLDAVSTEATTTTASTVKLFLGGVERAVGSYEELSALLEEVAAGGMHHKNEMDAPSYMDNDGTVTTKGVINFMDRHLPDSHALLLITSSDVSLPDTVLQSLPERGCSVHCHDAADDLHERLRREGARAGDVTISLAWDTVDDLDLHVCVPGGTEIYFGNRTSPDGLCVLDVDMNAGGPQSKEPVENVFLGDLAGRVQAPLGWYKVVVQNYAYHTPRSDGETPIPFRVTVDKNGVKQTYDGACLGTSSKSNVTVIEFDYQGRTIPFPGEEKNKTAFGTSNMVNLTASTGQTLESIAQLVQVVDLNEHLDVVRTLVDEGDDEHTPEAEQPPEEHPLTPAEVADQSNEEGIGQSTEPEVPLPPTNRRATQAPHGVLEVTSRDRINILLAKLPWQFHEIVGESLGGPTLAELCAEDIARRMVADRIPISQLQCSGYPRDVVNAVKAKMAVT